MRSSCPIHFSDHVKGATVLDVGCGEGFVSRKMTEMGAAKIVGIDISTGMIDGATTHKEKGRNEFFLVGDAAELKQQLTNQSAECNLMVRIKNTIVALIVSLLCLHALNQLMMHTLLSFPDPPHFCPSNQSLGPTSKSDYLT